LVRASTFGKKEALGSARSLCPFVKLANEKSQSHKNKKHTKKSIQKNGGDSRRQ